MEDLDEVVRVILRSPHIKNKIVLLCEGDLPTLRPQERLSPQSYARCEQLPDSNFYKSCVPRRWQNYRTPAFFNAGGRSQVLYIYQKLLERHRKDPKNSYLTPEKLYALVDLDIQNAELPADYRWKTTEAIHGELYADGALKAAVDDTHRIWVTALVHKEAFFILPSTATSLKIEVEPHWNGAPLDIRAIHAALALRIEQDGDVGRHFEITKSRLQRFACGSRLDCSDPARLGPSWLDAANTAGEHEYESLARALLAVAKAKEIWKEIVPNPAYGITFSTDQFRDQLALKIGAAISMLEPGAHPLAGFFHWLESRR